MNRPSDPSADVAEAPARFTVDEFMEMAAAGAFDMIEGKIELADGVIVRMPPPNFRHSKMQRQLFLKLHAIFGEGRDGLIAMFETGSRLSEWTMRQPDLSVIREPDGEVKLLDGAAIFLAVEVSEATLRRDLGPKRDHYAAAGVPHYWVVDLDGRKTHVFAAPAQGGYGEEEEIAFGAPVPVPGTGETIVVE
ncbi:MAG: Uma2 family endonuclease [Sphingomonadaceae bacterium]